MLAALTNVSAWRRILLVGIVVLTASLFVSFTRADDAHAFMNPDIVLPASSGWVYVRDRPADYTCSFVGTCMPLAWRWNATTQSWRAYLIPWGTQVYAYPYSGTWMRIWTQRMGVYVIQSNELSRHYSCTGPNCPVF